MDLKKYCIFIDLHGVLVDSKLMIKNYEETLIRLYAKYDVPKETAIKYHNQGLNHFSRQIESIKKKNITGEEFIFSMQDADESWDRLMSNSIQNYISNSKFPISSREVEFLAGSHANCFYPDAEDFLLSIINKDIFSEYFICSNAHSEHIRGIIHGSKLRNKFKKDNLIGWDQAKSLKNNIAYFQYLKKQSSSKHFILVGNSNEEMKFASRLGFKAILVSREYKGDKSESKGDLIIENLAGLTEKLKRFTK